MLLITSVFLWELYSTQDTLSGDQNIQKLIKKCNVTTWVKLWCGDNSISSLDGSLTPPAVCNPEVLI